MTILDTSVEYIRVLMILGRKTIVKESKLAQGYTYEKMNEKYYDAWCELMTECALCESIEKAHEVLEAIIQEDKAFFEDHFILVLKEEQVVASCGLWYGKDFDAKRLRLHYVATKPAHQGKGIAKAMITKMAMLYDSIPGKYPLYLVTQSQSYMAIALYARLGFLPYFGEYKGHSAKQSQEDWERVTEILKEKVPARS